MDEKCSFWFPDRAIVQTADALQTIQHVSELVPHMAVAQIGLCFW